MAGKEVYRSQEIERTPEGWKARKVWRVPTLDGIAAALDSDVAQPGDAFSPLAPALIFKSQRVRWENESNYLVTVIFSNIQSKDTEQHQIDDVRERLSFRTRVEEAIVDRDGNRIGQGGTGVQVLVPHVTLYVTTWIRYIEDQGWIYNLVTKTNEDTFKGRGQDHWLCMGADTEQETDSMLRVDYTFEHDASSSGWQFEWYEMEEQEIVLPSGKPDKGMVPIGGPYISRLYDRADFSVIYP